MAGCIVETSLIGPQIGLLKGKTTVQLSITNLENAKTVLEFKEVAKKILLEDSGEAKLNEILRLAHNMKMSEGRTKLVRALYSLKENLNLARPDKREQVIKRALRSPNPTASLPIGWRL